MKSQLHFSLVMAIRTMINFYTCRLAEDVCLYLSLTHQFNTCLAVTVDQISAKSMQLRVFTGVKSVCVLLKSIT